MDKEDFGSSVKTNPDSGPHCCIHPCNRQENRCLFLYHNHIFNTQSCYWESKERHLTWHFFPQIVELCEQECLR